MAIRPDWTVGTLNLTSGSVNFTTTGSALQTAGVEAGDEIITSSGHVLIIASVTGQNAGTLYQPCPAGAAGTGQPLRIRFQPDGSRYQGAARDLINLDQNGNISALSGLTGAPDKMPYFTGAGTMALAGFPAAARALLNLTGTAAADQIPYLTGTGAAALTGLSAFMRTVLDDADAATALNTITNNTRLGAIASGSLDFDAITETGVYGGDSATANRPGNAGNWLVLHMARTSTIHAQLALSRASYDVQYRYNNGSAWQPWRGMLVERGSNANGEYTRFPDGTQICWRNYIANAAAPWAATFSAAPMAVATVAGGGNTRIATFSSTPTTTNVTVQVNTEAGGASSSPGYVVGFGRWF